jgi:sodium/hydrogen exchanger 8
VQGVALVALAVSRAIAIWPAAAVVNALRPPELGIPQGQQFMIWFSGMRGAMAFAMVLRSLEELPGDLIITRQ